MTSKQKGVELLQGLSKGLNSLTVDTFGQEIDDLDVPQLFELLKKHNALAAKSSEERANELGWEMEMLIRKMYLLDSKLTDQLLSDL